VSLVNSLVAGLDQWRQTPHSVYDDRHWHIVIVKHTCLYVLLKIPLSVSLTLQSVTRIVSCCECEWIIDELINHKIWQNRAKERGRLG